MDSGMAAASSTNPPTLIPPNSGRLATTTAWIPIIRIKVLEAEPMRSAIYPQIGGATIPTAA